MLISCTGALAGRAFFEPVADHATPTARYAGMCATSWAVAYMRCTFSWRSQSAQLQVADLNAVQLPSRFVRQTAVAKVVRLDMSTPGGSLGETREVSCMRGRSSS
jgi:hypothetical protein